MRLNLRQTASLLLNPILSVLAFGCLAFAFGLIEVVKNSEYLRLFLSSWHALFLAFAFGLFFFLVFRRFRHGLKKRLLASVFCSALLSVFVTNILSLHKVSQFPFHRNRDFLHFEKNLDNRGLETYLYLDAYLKDRILVVEDPTPYSPWLRVINFPNGNYKVATFNSRPDNVLLNRLYNRPILLVGTSENMTTLVFGPEYDRAKLIYLFRGRRSYFLVPEEFLKNDAKPHSMKDAYEYW